MLIIVKCTEETMCLGCGHTVCECHSVEFVYCIRLGTLMHVVCHENCTSIDCIGED